MYTTISRNEVYFEQALEKLKPMIRRLCRNSAPLVEPEDLESELMLHLWECYQCYDPTRGSQFTTFAHHALERKRNMVLRTAKALKRGGADITISFDSPIVPAENGNRECSFSDIVADSNSSGDPEERLFLSELINLVYRVVYSFKNERVQTILLMALDGYTQCRISEEVGCRQSLVSYYLKNFRKKLEATLKEEGYGEFLPFSIKV